MIKLFHSRPSAILFYLMAASTGAEIGSFNVAFVCEEDPEKIVSTFLKKIALGIITIDLFTPT